jgi:hypothetical protein
MGYLNAQVFTHTLPDINSIKNAIPREIANVTQDTAINALTVMVDISKTLYCINLLALKFGI